MTEEKAESPLRAIIFAGPNGSGKSTITKAIVENPQLFEGEYINADNIAQSLENDIPDYRERNLKAANIAEERRLAAFRERRAVAFETVMSTPEKVALMTHARAQGYEVTLVFVTTDNPETNVQRVANRVARGGHSVEPEAIRERYAKVMDLLPSAFEHADQARVFDNSGEKVFLVAVKRDGEMELHNPDQHPRWVSEKLVNPYIERMASRDHLDDVFEAVAPSNATIKDADATNGMHYSGEIVTATKYHALQKTDDHTFVVHDRCLTATKDLELGKSNDVVYAFYKGKILTPDLQAVKAFEKEPPAAALEKHPQLAGAYAALALVEKRAEADGLDSGQRAIVIRATRANIARSIETGKYPEVTVREETELKREQSHER